MLAWTDFFPDTPVECGGAQIPISIVVLGFLGFCDLQSEIVFQRVNTRSYTSFVLALKIKAKATLLARQRVAIERVLFQHRLSNLSAPGALDDWITVSRPLLPIAPQPLASPRDLN